MAKTTIHSDYIPDNAITSTKIAENSIGAREIATNAITTLYVADGSVSSEKLASNIDIAGTFDVTGATTLDSTLSVSGDAYANTYRKNGDSDTYLNFPAANQLSLVGGGSEIVRAYQIAGAYGVLKVYGSGSATYPNFTFNGDDNTGMYRATTDTLAFTTGGSEAMRIDSSGIDVTGTATMDGLTVDSTSVTAATLNTNVNGSQITINDGTSSTVPWSVGIKNDGSNDFLIYNAGAENIELYTSDRIRQKIGSNGDISFYEDTGTTAKLFWDASEERLGIGTSITNSGRPLHLHENSSGSAFQQFTNTTTGTAGGNGFLVGVSSTEQAYLYNQENTDMVFATNDTERMRIDSTGNVVINKSGFSSLPTGSKLNVFGDGEVFRIDGSGATSRTIRFRNVGTNGSSNGIIMSDGTLQLKNEDANAAIYLNSVRDIEFQTTSGNSTAGHMRFYSYNTQIMHIDGANNRVGIGTDSPATPLQVVSTAGDWTADIKNYSTDAYGLRIDLSGSTGTAFAQATYTATGTGFFVKNNGNVGIGTSSPNEALEVNGDIQFTTSVSTTSARPSVTAATLANGEIRAKSSNTGDGGFLRLSAGGGTNASQISYIDLQGYSNAGGVGPKSVIVGTQGTDRMIIDGDGIMLLGTTTRTIGNLGDANRLGVAGNSNSVFPMVVFAEQDPTVEGGSCILELSYSGDTSFSNSYYALFSDSGGTQGSISGTGDGTVAYNTSSDSRLKENIVDTSSQLDKIKQVQVRDFNYIGKDVTTTGMIAQELNEIIPEVVTEGAEDATKHPWGVDYGKLTPFLIKAIQEQQTIIDDLKSRIETLEG